MTALTIRPEQPGDEEAIYALTKSAFAPMPFSDGDEPDLINRLREDGDLTLSLVALKTAEKAGEQAGEHEVEIVGHIAFSPARISDGSQAYFGLGPVSVAPHLQREGIGGAIIRRGIAEMTLHNARGIILLGSDEYYPRFGFEHDPALTYPGPPAQFFQRLVLTGEPPSGIARFAPAFEVSTTQ